jgi:protein-S-isoprenylcysteine O-methyltransferase Ste14
MALDTRQRSQLYVTAQFLLIALIAVCVLTEPATSNPLWHGIGFAICAPGVVIMVAALAAMGRLMRVWPEPMKDGHLVTRGVYAWLRHPMYTGITLVVIGLAVRTPTLGVIAAGGCLVALLCVKSRFEEQLLRARYPDYGAYRARTWGVITPQL